MHGLSSIRGADKFKEGKTIMQPYIRVFAMAHILPITHSALMKGLWGDSPLTEKDMHCFHMKSGCDSGVDCQMAKACPAAVVIIISALAQVHLCTTS